jgi:predicted SprT family Zn-dependent metalloprotease
MNSTPQEVVELAKQLMSEHGLVDWNVELMDNRRLHGQCRTQEKLIRLNRNDVFRKDRRFVVDTILHEIAHALTPHAGHGKEWRDVAYKIGVRDPGYNRYGLCAKLRLDPKPTDYAKKLAQAQARIKQLTTRKKRIETAIKKWQRRVKLYSRKVSSVPSTAS